MPDEDVPERGLPDRGTPEQGTTIAQRVVAVRARIAAAADRVGRDPAEVTLVAATKTVDAARVAEVVAAGVADLGENRAQELVAKAPLVATRLEALRAGASSGASSPTPRWHFLGALQRNKVRAVAPWVSCWQSVDRAALGAVIARHAPGARVFVEVNLGREDQKPGCPPESAGELCRALGDLGLHVEGLMAVPPRDDDPRGWFTTLRGLAAELGIAGLSMGMSDDFEIAVEEGATVVRVGRAIFGERPT
ncbi:MAG TPA: YggS family pyridoxal phosphate-dependent enzyme [Acidimicrobiia bacterium]|nr:YggS family pyridoxal phosphate-dependent enzyme [Acidimicrobiia bacterium]